MSGTKRNSQVQTSLAWKPPEPPPLPPQPIYIENANPCYFRDGIRKIDYILVYSKDKLIRDDVGNEKIRSFVTALEDAGLEMEGEDGYTDKNLTFVKVHGAEKLLIHYAKIYNINLVMEAPFYFPPKPPYLKCMRNEANTTDPSYSFVYQRAPDSFSGTRPNIMSDSERIMVVAKLMKTVRYGPMLSERGIDKLIKDKIFMDAYPIHDGAQNWAAFGELCERQILRRYWSKLNQCFKSQPIYLIQRYFGPETAFYFAWSEFYTIMLAPMALIGLASCLFGLISIAVDSTEICEKKMDNIDICPPCNYANCNFRKLSDFCWKSKFSYIFGNHYTLLVAVCTSIWANIVIIYWERNERKLALTWDLDQMIISEEQRTDYIEKATVVRISSATGLPEKYLSNTTKYCRIAFTYVTCIFLGMLIAASISGIGILRLSTQIFLNKKKMSPFEQLIAYMLSSWVTLCAIIVFTWMNRAIILRLNAFEIPRTQWEFDNSLVYKTFLMEFVNKFSPVLYLAFFKGMLYKHPGSFHDIKAIEKLQGDRCDVGGCGLELAIQLLFIMTFDCLKRNYLSIFWPRFYRCLKKCRYCVTYTKMLPRWEQDFYLTNISYYHIHREYMHTALQYGYVVCFVAVFPLAPVLAFIGNILELRLDAYKLTNQYRRPIPKQVPGMGAWLDVMQIITYIGTVINAFIIAFTGEFISKIIYAIEVNFFLEGYVHSTLSKFSIDDYPTIADVPKPNMSICYYSGKRYPPDHPLKYQLTRGFWYEIAIKFLFAVIFEHVMMLINHLLRLLIPKVSTVVRKRLKFEKNQLREARLKLLNEAYKKHHGDIAMEQSKRMHLPRVDVMTADTII